VDKQLVVPLPSGISRLRVCATRSTLLIFVLVPTSAHAWRTPLYGGSAAPVVSNGVVFVGTRDGLIEAFAAASGSRLWSFRTGEGLPPGGITIMVSKQSKRQWPLFQPGGPLAEILRSPQRSPVPKSDLAPNVPSPLPSSTETVLDSLFATTRSGRPSLFSSPIATDCGPPPVPKSVFTPNVPSPLPSNTETVLE